MLEKDVKKWTKELLQSANIKIQPIESPSTGNGIPDWFYRAPKNEGWIEFKYIEQLHSRIVIPFRPGQFSWLMNYTKLNGNAFLIVGYYHEKTAQNCLAIFRSEHIQREYDIKDFYLSSVVCKAMRNISAFELYTILNSKS